MAGDGVSLPQTIAQMGSVAKTQAKGQQGTQQTTPFADQLNKKDDLKVQRVKDTQKAEQQKVKADEDKKEKDRRKRRRMKRQNKLLVQSEDSENSTSEKSEADAEQMGVLIDLRV